MTSNLLLDVDVCSTSWLLLIGRRFERHELVDETTIFLRCDGCKDRSNRRSSHRFFHPTAQHVFRIGECRSNIGISFPAPWNDLGHTNYEGFLRIPHDESIHRYLPYLKMSHEKSNYFIQHFKFSQQNYYLDKEFCLARTSPTWWYQKPRHPIGWRKCDPSEIQEPSIWPEAFPITTEFQND